MTHQFIPIGAGQRLYAQYGKSPDGAEKEKTLIIMMHGFPGLDMDGEGRVFVDLEDILAPEQHDTIRFDFRGCGNSSGRPEEFSLSSAGQDVQAVISWARKKSYQRFVFIGEGLGAAIALQNMTSAVRGLVMFWPMLDMKQTPFRNHFPALKNTATHKSKTVSINGTKISLGCLKELATLNLTLELQRLRAPLLVEHGDADLQSPIDQLELLRRHAGNAGRLHITSYEKGTHGLPQPTERENIFRQVRAFMQKYA